jgi:rSAM/selenodomain-associated transferase 1
MTALMVLAKAPELGRSKTRLCPPFTPVEAARLAAAALSDTLDAVAAAGGAARRLLVLDGEPGRWLRPGFEVLPQRGGGLDERLASAFEDAGEPALLIGMDTPQVTPDQLRQGLSALGRLGVDAVLGPAADGGYWAIGLRRPDRAVFLGVPMSDPATLSAQRERLCHLGLHRVELPALRDVDRAADAWAVAAEAPGSRFARAFGEIVRAGVPA